MANVTTVICDECGTQKREVNHWYVAFKSGAHIVSVATMDGIGDAPNQKHLCGQSCIHSLLDRWMTTGSLEK